MGAPGLDFREPRCGQREGDRETPESEAAMLRARAITGKDVTGQDPAGSAK
jgi:hypothetical protein